MRYALWFFALLGSLHPVTAQPMESTDQAITAIYRSFAGHEPRLSGDDRLKEPVWRVTLQSPDTIMIKGFVAFRDNDQEENEVTWSEDLEKRAGLMDALWIIQPGQSGWGELIFYSNGERLQPVGSLLQGRYTLIYTRNGKSLRLLLERP